MFTSSPSTSLSDKEILHRSILPTDHFQKSLPRLPVPKLEDTCTKYLNSQSVLLSEEKYKHTENVTHGFRDGIGKGRIIMSVQVSNIPSSLLLTL